MSPVMCADMDRHLIKLFLLCTLLCFCYGKLYDCGDASAGQKIEISVKETDPKDTVIASFNNSIGSLEWGASINGTNKGYLSLFFKSSAVDGRNMTHALRLTKPLDLELLELELAAASQMFSGDNLEELTLDLSISCFTADHLRMTWNFQIGIQPVNEFIPQFIGAPFTAVLSEDTAVGTDIFDLGTRVTDFDAGKTTLTFAITPYVITQFDGSKFAMMDEAHKGRLLLSQPLDFESFLKTGRMFMFINVTATDDGGLTSSTTINLTVTDANDQGVQFLYPRCATPCQDANYTAITNESYVGPLTVRPVRILAADLDTLNDTVIYSIVSNVERAYFSIDESTGELYKTGPLVNDTFDYMISVTVRAQEVSDEDHYLDTNVTVYVEERRPKPARFKDSRVESTVKPVYNNQPRE